MEKITGNEPAFPLEIHEGQINNPGLTKREYLAAMALSGFLSSPQSASAAIEDIAERSVFAADKLIEQLNKNQ